MLTDSTVRQYSDDLASSSPAPGGGSAAALAGATAAALVSMVCNLTIGRPKFAEVEPRLRTVLAESERLRARLLALVDEDTLAYPRVIAAYRLPRGTDDEKRQRQAAIQTALVFACEAPMSIAEACANVADLCPDTCLMGNPAAVSDGGVAALLAAAACESALLNIETNLGSIRDQAFAATANARRLELVQRSAAARDRSLVLTRSKFGSA